MARGGLVAPQRCDLADRAASWYRREGGRDARVGTHADRGDAKKDEAANPLTLRMREVLESHLWRGYVEGICGEDVEGMWRRWIKRCTQRVREQVRGATGNYR